MRIWILGLFSALWLGVSQAAPSLETIAENIDTPWAVTMVTSDQLLISQRKGDLLLLSGLAGELQKTVIDFTPDDLYFAGQGGLLDILLHPNYAQNNFIYISYSAGSEDANFLKVVRVVLDVNAQKPTVSSVDDIFEVVDRKDTPVHYAGRLAFDDAGNLLVASGDGFDYREEAQVLTSHLGKILRMTENGEPVSTNPFYDSPDVPQSYVYSLGHRNHQGLVVLEDGTIVSNEHGPDGGDEMNIIVAGNNYGWPVITNGMDYIGATISPFREYPGMEQPLVDWTPSIAPSAMIFYDHDKFSEFTDKFLITSLKFKRVYVINSDFEKLPDRFTDNDLRLRDIEKTPDGNIYILTDGADAKLYRVSE